MNPPESVWGPSKGRNDPVCQRRSPSCQNSTCRPKRARTAKLFVLALALSAWAGCAGYQIGSYTLYPADIHTVYVPVFASSSFRRQLGERLTEAVIKEIELKTPYKVVGDANADSILSGRITGETKRVLVENRFDEPREVETNLQVQVQWLDRQRNIIRQMEPVPVPPELVRITESATLIPEVGQSVAVAHQQAIHRLAEQIVSMMEAPW